MRRAGKRARGGRGGSSKRRRRIERGRSGGGNRHGEQGNVARPVTRDKEDGDAKMRDQDV